MLVLGLLIAMTASPVDLVHSVDTATLSVQPAAAMTGVTGSVGGYDAAIDKGRRRQVSSRIVREDNLLKTGRRNKLAATTQDLVRNFSLAGWMIRRHLDYVALFDFHSRLTNSPPLRARFDQQQLKDFDQQIETLMRNDSRPGRCDVAGRFGREKMFRLAEMQRTVAGDVGLVKLADGRLQGIEGDLIRQPDGKDLRSDEFQSRGGDKSEWTCYGRSTRPREVGDMLDSLFAAEDARQDQDVDAGRRFG